MIKRIDLTPNLVSVAFESASLLKLLDQPSSALDNDALCWSVPLTLRRRGVETRIILGNIVSEPDHVLLSNIRLARRWYRQIIAGKTYGEVAADHKTDRSRIKQMIALAFLAPDILKSVVEGSQPTDFTSEWIKSHDLPADWSAQRVLMRSL